VFGVSALHRPHQLIGNRSRHLSRRRVRDTQCSVLRRHPFPTEPHVSPPLLRLAYFGLRHTQTRNPFLIPSHTHPAVNITRLHGHGSAPSDCLHHGRNATLCLATLLEWVLVDFMRRSRLHNSITTVSSETRWRLPFRAWVEGKFMQKRRLCTSGYLSWRPCRYFVLLPLFFYTTKRWESRSLSAYSTLISVQPFDSIVLEYRSFLI
jgi:hypothetical protein